MFINALFMGLLQKQNFAQEKCSQLVFCCSYYEVTSTFDWSHLQLFHFKMEHPILDKG